MGLRVSGKLAPETVKPVPVTVAALTVTDAVPVEDRVRDWVAGELRATLPKAMVVVLTLSVGVSVAVAVPNCKAKLSATLPALAVRVAVCAVLTGETVAVNVALFAPAATVTEAGTETEDLLLASLTLNPPLGAAALSATVQESVPAPVIDPLAQLNTPRFVVFVAPVEVPVPLSPIAIVPSAGELLVIVTWPDAAPFAAGEKLT